MSDIMHVYCVINQTITMAHYNDCIV